MKRDRLFEGICQSSNMNLRTPSARFALIFDIRCQLCKQKIKKVN